MISLNDLLNLWGFVSHPFETYTAESEPRLTEYFVAPPYLDDMIGTASAMTPAIVFGARGIGKSAIRIYIENLCTRENPEKYIRGKAVAIAYVDFSGVLENGLESVSLNRHLETVLHKMVAATLLIMASALADKSISEATIKAEFPELDIPTLAYLVNTYFVPLTDLQKKTALGGIYNYFKDEVTSITQRATWFQNIWASLRVPILDITNVILALKGKELVKPVDLHFTPQSSERTTEELINDFQTMASLTTKLQIDGWYILIDKVDEDNYTDSDAIKSAKLILPLLKNLRVLETPNVGFKFFLWDQLRPSLSEERVRIDKIRNWDMVWTKQELTTMIDKRLSTYSNGIVTSLLSITDDDASDIYDEVIYYTMSSPREIMHILDEIFREHARHSTQDTGVFISRASIDKGINNYCLRRVKDMYPEDIIRAIRRLPSVQFTSNDVQSLFRISQQAASARIHRWIDDGYIERAEDIRSTKDPSKFIYQYQIREKRVERLIQLALSEDNVL